MRRSIVSWGILRLFLFFPLIVVSLDVPQDLAHVELDVCQRSDDVLHLVSEDSGVFVHRASVPMEARVRKMSRAAS